MMEQQLIGTEQQASNTEQSENWLEKQFEKCKIIFDAMKVKFEEKCNLVNIKQKRIFELENVLKTSVSIASERENEYFNLVEMNKDMDMKVRVNMVSSMSLVPIFL